MADVANSQISRGGILFLGFVLVVSPIPALNLLIRGQQIPLPLALVAFTPITSGITMFVVDRLLGRSASVVGRTVAGVLMSVVGALVAAGLMGQGAPVVTAAIPRPEVTLVKVVLLGSTTSLIYAGVFAMGLQFLQFLARDERRALELRALQFESSELRARAELARLRTQIEPHFLLNTLNVVSALVGADVDLARKTLSDLGDLLRETLEATTERRSVDAEVRWLRRHCDILVIRHGAALKIEWHIDEGARDASVPSLLLQPLVENAIVHGALALNGRGHVRISITSRDGVLRAEVEDDGASPSHAVESFELGVVDYLHKPINQERVRRALERVGSRQVLRAGRVPRIVARKKRNLVFSHLDEVWAFESSQGLSLVHSDRGVFDVDLSLDAAESSMARTFQRVHRNWLVSESHILEFERGEGETALWVGSRAPSVQPIRVPVARERAASIRASLMEVSLGLRKR